MNTVISILIILGIVILSVTSCAVITHCFCSMINKKNYASKFFYFTLLYHFPAQTLAQLITLYCPKCNMLKPILTTLSIILISKFLYKMKTSKSILCGFLCLITSAILDIIFSIGLMLFGFDIVNIISTPCKYLEFSLVFNIFQILVPSIAYIILYRRNYFSKDGNASDLFSLTNDYKHILYQFVVIIICILPSMFLMVSKTYDYPVAFLIINVFQITIASFLAFNYTKKRIIYQQTMLELANAKLYNEALATINENVRGFKHDMSNIVQSMNGYITTNDLEGGREYCAGLLKGFNDINILSILSPKIINEPAIYGIVVGKILLARQKGISLNIDINCDVNQINFPKFELSRTLGILLDNAIEACEKSDEKMLKLNMFFNSHKNADVIIIGNSVEDARKIELSKIFEKDYSTKPNPSGFGLYEIIKFLRKYDTGDIFPAVDYENNFFTQTLTFKRFS